MEDFDLRLINERPEHDPKRVLLLLRYKAARCERTCERESGDVLLSHKAAKLLEHFLEHLKSELLGWDGGRSCYTEVNCPRDARQTRSGENKSVMREKPISGG